MKELTDSITRDEITEFAKSELKSRDIRIKELEDEISDLKCTIYQVETTVKTLMRLR